MDRIDEAVEVALSKFYGSTDWTRSLHRDAMRAALLAALPVVLGGMVRHDVHIAGGCECCGTWIDSEPCKNGEWVKWSDLAALYAPSLGEGDGR
jgi:hypothetical protein